MGLVMIAVAKDGLSKRSLERGAYELPNKPGKATESIILDF